MTWFGCEKLKNKKKRFTFDCFPFNGEGYYYVIAKEQCSNKDRVIDFIIKKYNISPSLKCKMVLEEGWCCYKNDNLKGYIVLKQKDHPINENTGKIKNGYFPVWIVRKV